MEHLLRLFNDNYITRQNIMKYFTMGDKFNDEEMNILMRMIPFDSTDCVSISDFVNFVYE
jgi:hypothetical protein